MASGVERSSLQGLLHASHGVRVLFEKDDQSRGGEEVGDFFFNIPYDHNRHESGKGFSTIIDNN